MGIRVQSHVRPPLAIRVDPKPRFLKIIGRVEAGIVAVFVFVFYIVSEKPLKLGLCIDSIQFLFIERKFTKEGVS